MPPATVGQRTAPATQQRSALSWPGPMLDLAPVDSASAALVIINLTAVIAVVVAVDTAQRHSKRIL